MHAGIHLISNVAKAVIMSHVLLSPSVPFFKLRKGLSTAPPQQQLSPLQIGPCQTGSPKSRFLYAGIYCTLMCQSEYGLEEGTFAIIA